MLSLLDSTSTCGGFRYKLHSRAVSRRSECFLEHLQHLTHHTRVSQSQMHSTRSICRFRMVARAAEPAALARAVRKQEYDMAPCFLTCTVDEHWNARQRITESCDRQDARRHGAEVRNDSNCEGCWPAMLRNCSFHRSHDGIRGLELGGNQIDLRKGTACGLGIAASAPASQCGHPCRRVNARTITSSTPADSWRKRRTFWVIP